MVDAKHIIRSKYKSRMADISWERMNIPQELVCNFLAVLARFENALKATNYMKSNNSWVKPDWDRFAKDGLPREIERDLVPNLKQAIDYLLSNPPKKQVVESNRVLWQPLPLPNNLTETQRLARYVRQVRNNLFHGGKFLEPETTDPERDRILVEASLSVLEAFLKGNSGVMRAYES